MIQVLSLQRDGVEQPQFYALAFRYPDMGAGYDRTTIFGTETSVRDVLRNGGIAQADIDNFFANANH
jgi:hypothetical protein